MSKNFLRMPDGEYIKVSHINELHVIKDDKRYKIEAYKMNAFNEVYGNFKTKEEAQAYLDTIMDTEGIELDSYND